MKAYALNIILFSLIAWLSGCHLFNGNNTDDAVARVGDNILLREDVKGLSVGESEEDSISIVQSYIDNWIKEQLLLKKAEQNLSENQLDFNQQLENYRKSLIIYAYENQLVKQKLDTNVKTAEIEAYYQANQASFDLKEPLYLARYIEFLSNAPKQDSLELWFYDETNDSQENLNDYCTRFASSCQLDTSMWIAETQWQDILPLDTNSNYKNLIEGRNIQSDSLRTIWVDVKKVKKVGESAPVNYVKAQIKSIILNRRRISLIAEVKKEIFEEATLNKKYEIY